MTDPPVLVPARIRWEGATLYSEVFADSYFSAGQGPAESRHVFLNGNHLEARFRDNTGQRFRVLETGFGTGLNFLLTSELWRRTHQPGSWLDYYAVEGHPLARTDLAKAVETLCPGAADAARLVSGYPPAVAGIFRLDFPASRTSLVLCQYPINQALEELVNADGMFDAFYLDGFAPDRNPAMWSSSVIKALYRLARPAATFATYSAAGAVRRALVAAGFSVERRPGFAPKREHLAGSRPGSKSAHTSEGHRQRVAVVGAGLAGAATARALAARGLETRIFDPGANSRRVGNALSVAVYGPQLSADFNLTSRFYWHGLWRLKDWLSRERSDWFTDSGICFFAWHDEDRRRYRKLLALLDGAGTDTQWLEADQILTRLGVRSQSGALHCPHGGAVDTRRLRKAWLKGSGGTLQIDCRPVTDIAHTDGGWRINGQDRFDAVVLATGASQDLARRFGVDSVRLNHGRAWGLIRPDLPAVDTVLSFRGYLTPRLGTSDLRLFGATYERGIPREEIASRMRDDKRQRLEHVSDIALSDAELSAAKALSGWRAESRDRLPLVGAAGASLPGLYFNLAHASRGATSSLLCGELIAAQFCSDIPPLPRRLLMAIDPRRFGAYPAEDSLPTITGSG